MFNRELITRFLLRRPAELQSRTARAAVLALAGIGGAFLVWSAVIHLELSRADQAEEGVPEAEWLRTLGN